jgi:alkanesulfonate monooxygenase SsuD/methylene tetrahydromethanopterin reductase-like flavin-dependent oxidoreductase (luciferase family)
MAWAGGVIVKQARNFNATGNEPRPVLASPPPIWIGGGSSKALERAALWGDGWSPFFAAPTMTKANQESGIHSVEQLGEHIDKLQEMRAKLNKTGPFDVTINARAKLDYTSRESADKFLKAASDLAEAGVTWVMVEPPHPSRQGFLENVQWFGEEIVAHR